MSYTVTYKAVKEEVVNLYLDYQDNVNSLNDAVRYAERLKKDEMEMGYRMEGNIADKFIILDVSEDKDE